MEENKEKQKIKEQWKKLLSSERLQKEDAGEDIRSAFERDADRIIYSYPFRRMQDKTQVIPLPVIDFVHTRLTHSLEVATVGRSLGKLVEEFLLKNGDIEEEQKGHIPTIVYAACLAHDMGNPPFGHSGEDSISDYFVSGKGKNDIDNFTEEEKKDLQSFEGNALGFHILNNYEGNGLNLTCATLATFTKYPRPSFIEGDKDELDENNDPIRWNEGISQKKYGFFQQDLETFKKVATETGMILFEGQKNAWYRHPLAFLMEAADDICYRIIDLEDGFRIGKIPFSACESSLLKIAKEWEKWKASDYCDKWDNKKKFAFLRAKVVNKLIYEVFEVFKDNYDEIMMDDPKEGKEKFDKELSKEIKNNNIKEAMKEIKTLVTENVYKSHDVLTLEAAGYEVLGGLLQEFIQASNICQECNQKFDSKRNEKYYDLIPEEYKENKKSFYERYLSICNYVAGMSDSYAVNLYQRVKGIKPL